MCSLEAAKAEQVFVAEAACPEMVVDVGVVVDVAAGLTVLASVAGGAWSTRRAIESRRAP